MGEWRRSVCPRDCPDCCGLLFWVEDGRVLKVKGDPEHPFTKGFICQKARHFPDHIHSPARLTTPLKRVGAKGEGRFAPVSWEEAFGLMTAKLQEVAAAFGPQAIMPYSYAGHMGVVHRNAGHAFFHRLGATRLLYTICGAAAEAGYVASLGGGPSAPLESAADSDFIIIWGSNTLTTNLHAWPHFQAARRRGARLVVIDPYRNRTAREADRHLMPRPGTDAALALGMMAVLIEEDLLDHAFLARHTVGFDRLRERVREYPPARAAAICGLAPAAIVELAREYGRARAPFIRTGWGLSRQLRGGMAMRTIALLPALVGALAKGGGGIARSSGAAAPLNLAGLTRPDLAPPGGRVVNMVQLGDALTALADPPIKYLHVYLSNPAVVAPDSNRVLAGLAREDLFTVVQEQFATDTARYADLVLPSRSFAELSDLYRSYGHHCLQLARPVIPPVGQSRSLLAVFQELARRLGFTEEVFSQDEDAIIAGLLRQDSPFLAGITPADLAGGRPAGLKVPANPYAQGFLTPSGKVEFYSESLARRGLDPLPDGTPSLDEEGRGRYPLQLITPPKHEFLNSSFNEIPELVAKAGPASLLIHPVDAACRGVAEGALVRVRNDRGDCLLHARLTEDTRPGLVVAEGLYWPGHTPGGKGINRLTSQRLGDMGQTCAFHCNLVEVEPAPA